MASSSFMRRFARRLSNLATRMRNPQRRTSCHRFISSSGTSSKGKSFQAALTISRVCGTFRPRNSSPSPYSPLPVLKKRIRISLCFSSRSDSI